MQNSKSNSLPWEDSPWHKIQKQPPYDFCHFEEGKKERREAEREGGGGRSISAMT